MIIPIEIIPHQDTHFRVRGSKYPNVADAFGKSTGQGFLALVQSPQIRTESDSCAYWFDYASHFVKSMCSFSSLQPFSVPVNQTYLEQKLDALPLMVGSDQIDQQFLSDLWFKLEDFVRQEVDQHQQDPRKFLKKQLPDWQDVGKIFFHLAESKKKTHPFSFLATYSVRVPGKARIQHRPIGLALLDSMELSDQQQIKQLLLPVYVAAQKSHFVEEIIASNSIYSQLPLTAEQAHRLIADIPVCEQSGIICKMPDWWQNNRPHKAVVSIKLGNKKKSRVGAEQLVDFDVRVSIGGKKLTKAELQRVMDSDASLIEISGKWVEVDRKKINKLLSVWDDALNSSHHDGISFIEAMRLYSGFDVSDKSLAKLMAEEESAFVGDQTVIASDQKWSEVVLGEAFKQQLDEIRHPKASDQFKAVLDQHLHATLRDYQAKGLGWLNSVNQLGLGGCLADDMGLGKTIQVLAMLITQKHHFGVKRPSLLVVPASLMGNWLSEMKKFTPSLKCFSVHRSLDGASRPQNFDDYDIYLTTYGMVLRQEWLSKTKWQFVVADEAQAIKNPGTKQSRMMRSLKAQAKIAMTGTPVENSLGDLWSLFDFCCPGLLGSASQFKQAIKKMRGEEDGDASDYSALRRLISPYILRRKKTDKNVIDDLPDKIEMKSDCYLTKEQAKLYQAEVIKLQSILNKNEKDDDSTSKIKRKGLVLGSLMKFKKICNHPSQFKASDDYQAALSGKFLKLKELVETIAAKQEKLLVFTQFKELTDILEHFLAECFGRRGLVIHGGVAVGKRQGLVDQFQDPMGPPFFVLSIKAGGTGLNLTQANHVIHFDRWWNPAVENQATDRAFRIGQKKNVLVHKFVCKGTIEEKIDLMIQDKQSLSDAVVEDSSEVSITEMSNEQILDMVKLDIDQINRGAPIS